MGGGCQKSPQPTKGSGNIFLISASRKYRLFLISTRGMKLFLLALLHAKQIGLFIYSFFPRQSIAKIGRDETRIHLKKKKFNAGRSSCTRLRTKPRSCRGNIIRQSSSKWGNE